MTFNEIMDEQRIDKRIIDDLGIPYLDYEDMEVCDYVSDELSKVSLANSHIKPGKKISYDEMVEKSLDELSIFGDDLRVRMLDTLNKTQIYRTGNMFGFGGCVNYEHDFYGDIPEYGKVSAYIIPKKLYEVSSVFFSHEQIHALKDTKYNEYYYNKTLGETIPMFFELISCFDNDSLRTEMFKVRLNFLFDNRTEYLLFSNLIREKKLEYSSYGRRNTLEEIELYKFICSKVGCYLNSYYYAIVLYHLYKQDPKRILGLVSSILRQEMTTFDLLNGLGIYADIKGKVFEKELGNIKKLVK